MYLTFKTNKIKIKILIMMNYKIELDINNFQIEYGIYVDIVDNYLE